MTSTRSVQMRVKLETDTADSVRHITIPGWTGTALMCSRRQYLTVRDRADFARPGVYVLVSPGDNRDPRQQLYIGQTNSAGERLDNHRDRKSFWTDLILFTENDGSLNSAHCRHIEHHLYKRAKDLGRVTLLNGNTPGGAHLDSTDRAIADEFLERMLLIYPLLGVNAFIPPVPDDPVLPPPPPPIRPVKTEQWTLTRVGCNGKGVRTTTGFLLLAGSIGRAAITPGLPGPTRVRRQSLIDDGTLRVVGDQVEVTRNYECGSPPWAGVVLTGGAINGRTAWKNADGLTIEQVDAAGKKDTD